MNPLRHPLVVPVGLLAALLAGCKSSEAHRADADREVYEIVRQRRDELAAGGDFTIERPTDTLRARLEAGAGELEPLGLVDCLRVAAENSRDFQSEREALYLAGLDLTLERWNFSVQETGTFGAFLDGVGTRATGQSVLSDLGLTKLFGTGLAIFGNAGLDFVRAVGNRDGWDAVSSLSLSITQPLLRGFGAEVVREDLTQAERDVLYQAREYERFRRTFAFDVAQSYFLILQAEDTLENERQNHANLITLRERNEAFAEAGQLTDIEVDQARQDEFQAENRVISARQDLESQLDDFKLFLGLPIDVPLALDRSDAEGFESWNELLEVDFREADVIDVALTERLDFQTTQDRVVDAERKVRVAADDLRAGVDLVASGVATSREGRPLDFPRAGVGWSLGLDIDLPIDRLPERNDFRATLIDLEAARRDAEEEADSIVNDLRDSLRDLYAARESYAIQTGAVELAERRVDSAQLNLEAGRANTRDVLEAQEDLVSAKNSATRDLTQYILSGIDLYLGMELIRVSESGIEVDASPLQERMGERP